MSETISTGTAMAAPATEQPTERPKTLLRELTDDEFRARYDCDRFTASVLASRFRYIIEHVCNRFIEHAFSPVIRETTDMSATITGPPSIGHAMPAVSQTLPIFYGSMPEAVRIALTEHGVDDLVPGDVIIVNDPYRVGTHLNDVCFIRPAFHDGRMIGAVTIRAHMLDMGGVAVGGFEVTKPDLYHDGLVLPPTLLFHAGAPVRSTFNLLFDNTRFAEVIVPDIQTINSSLELGERLLAETVTKYGYGAYLGGIRYACDSSAESMRAAIRRLPDGVYTAQERLDSDGVSADVEPVVQLRIHKQGHRIEFDLSGTSPANDTAINCSWADAKTAVAIALKYLLDPHSPFTSGSMRDVDVVLPPDSMINPNPPHTCQYYWEPAMAIIYATFQALNPVLGDDAISPDCWGGTIHYAYGPRPDGTPWMSTALNSVTAMGPWGATKQADGDSSQLQIVINMVDGGCEVAEVDTPVVILRHDHIPDTAGPGRYRSGAASIADSLWLADGEHRVSSFHLRSAPGGGGVNGGRAGVLSAAWLWPSTTASEPDYFPVSLSDPRYAEATPLMGVLHPTSQQVDPDGTYHLQSGPILVPAGSVLRFVSNGAGGWGDPLDREPRLVLVDVRDEYVTIDGAARDYGVVVVGDPVRDPEGLSVDAQATARLRAGRRTAEVGS
ncbi:hydantoinase B/oxoprolinase family protein [Mycobacterium marseillense]|uniref:hydantoinase B/oxoprolinase family protein n=1 Tax=Mycobacterium marseillense TaxID=701042 RepID=UPI002593767C|nr:hydantoinase B/oxoprolinase family protein [Mycobacterium marseillense]MDM3973560.1 hydantoinase B/oxoprolinase family protein [Mycobacterium marseillense]